MKTAKPTANRLPLALRQVRLAKGMAQEAFDQVSSRNYISNVERGLKAPTLNKIDEFAAVLQVHPLTLLALSYVQNSPAGLEQLLGRVANEVAELG